VAQQFRPKADAGENVSVDIALPNTGKGTEVLSVSSWPYEPKSAQEAAALSQHPLLTDAPAPKSKKEA
jgi:hypothetical protein